MRFVPVDVFCACLLICLFEVIVASTLYLPRPIRAFFMAKLVQKSDRMRKLQSMLNSFLRSFSISSCSSSSHPVHDTQFCILESWTSQTCSSPNFASWLHLLPPTRDAPHLAKCRYRDSLFSSLFLPPAMLSQLERHHAALVSLLQEQQMAH